MVKLIENNEDIISIWSESFGDSKDDILYFIDNVKNAYCLGYYGPSGLESMLYLVKCNVKSVESNYVYAACTYVKHRGNGSMTKLLDYCKQNNSSVCLIPADDSLVKFYNDRYFNKVINIDDISFNEIDGIKEYLFEGCTLNEPFALMYMED